MNTYPCTRCGIPVIEDEVMWRNDKGEATTGDDAKPYCYECECEAGDDDPVGPCLCGRGECSECGGAR